MSLSLHCGVTFPHDMHSCPPHPILQIAGEFSISLFYAYAHSCVYIVCVQTYMCTVLLHTCVFVHTYMCVHYVPILYIHTHVYSVCVYSVLCIVYVLHMYCMQCLDVCFGQESTVKKEQSVVAVTEVFQNISIQKVSILLQ